MKVLHAGKTPVFVCPEMRFTCPECGCRFTLEANDEYFRSGFRVLSGMRPFPLRCPQCESFVAMGTIVASDKT